MDTSPEFVQMCRKAEEIQEQWNWKEIDFYAAGEHTCKDFTNPKIITGVCSEPYLPENKCSFCKRPFYAEIWVLPRQDQLIELLGFRSAPVHVLDNISLIIHLAIKGKSRLWHQPIPKEYFESPSFEQLLLVVLMLERWGLRWNGSNWVAEE